MPVVKTYKGRIVTRMSRVSGGKLLLTFANANVGDRHERLTITEDDWRHNGTSTYTKVRPEREPQANVAG